jgi:hypothetical protein
MRQDARWDWPTAPTLLRALLLHLHNNGADLPVSDPLGAALRTWADTHPQQRQQGQQGQQLHHLAQAHPQQDLQEYPEQAAPLAQHERGYLWKTLFLPHATQLRLECTYGTFHAHVEGDEILFEGRSVSPRGMMVAVAGEGRNAWRDLSLRMPGAQCWKRANACRLEQQREQQREHAARAHPPSPADSMAAAAASMAAALETTLALARHCSDQAANSVERRGGRHRRGSDLQGEDCDFD